MTKKMKSAAEQALIDAGKTIKTKEAREAYEDAIAATEEAELSSKRLAKERREAKKLDEELKRLVESDHNGENREKIVKLRRRQMAEKMLNNQAMFARFRGNRQVQAIKEKDENRKVCMLLCTIYLYINGTITTLLLFEVHFNVFKSDDRVASDWQVVCQLTKLLIIVVFYLSYNTTQYNTDHGGSGRP
jgi:hypothetical protein